VGTGKSRRIPANIRKNSLRKLAVLDSAEVLRDLVDPQATIWKH